MISNNQQRTDDWKTERLGHITASRVADIMTEPRSKADKEAGKLSATALSYLYDLIGEHLSGVPEEEFDTYAMRRGVELEPEARSAYCWRTGNAVVDVGFVKHPTLSHVGASPDGLSGTDGTLEIKCPLSYANHVRVLCTQEIPSDYWPQVQMQLWVAGRQWCDFCSYHPSFPEPHNLVIVRVPRDDAYIADMAAKVESFRRVLLGRLETLTRKEKQDNV